MIPGRRFRFSLCRCKSIFRVDHLKQGDLVMNKKLIAAAVAGVVLSPAVMAQGSNPVTLYGRMDVNFQSVRAAGGTTPLATRNRVSDESSRLGVRGTEDLGGGTRAWFQIESAVSPDVGGASLASRNSGVGLQAGWGSILLGRWDTPYKLGTIPVDPWGDVRLPGMVTTIHDNGNFDLRPNNTVQYWTPNIQGFQARVHYSANEGKTANANPTLYSLGVTYDKGPLYLHVGTEQHRNRTGGADTAVANFKETGNQISGMFRAGKSLKVGLTYETIKKSTWANKQKNVLFNGTYTTGPHNILFMIGSSKDGRLSAAGSGNPKASTWGLGYNYVLSKRTYVYADIAQIKNNESSNKDFGSNNLGRVNDRDPRGFAVGIQHNF
jgi:predicted porin